MARATPVIDLQGFPLESERLREACEELGCFRIVNHGIPMALMAEMKAVVTALFDLPQDIKRRNIHVITGSGYVPPSDDNPFYEAFGLYDLASSQAVRAFCAQLHASPQQRETVLRYSEAVHELAMEIGRKLAQCLGLNTDLFVGWPCQFRINKYHFSPQTVGLTGVQIHTDSGFLTILQDDESNGGLEVMDKNSGEFTAVDPLPGTFLVNLGDMATIWSNGRFCNVKHRVQCREAKVRVSIAMFVLGPREEEVEAPPELVDTDHPRLYAPITFQDYRKLWFSTGKAGRALHLIRTTNC